MKDLTQGAIHKHLLSMAAPMAIGMLVQTLYYLIDLYFVSRLGAHALAGVGAGGSVAFLVLALTQALSVGTVTLVSHAVGRKDQAEANLVFNQSLLLAAACAALTVFGGYVLADPYLHRISADPETMRAGITYLYWYTPGLALQFALATMGAALRGTGVVKPTMLVQMLTVLINIILAPVLIAGWGTGHPLGVAGAGLASTIAVAVGVIVMGYYFAKLETYVGYDAAQIRPRWALWKRMLNIGAPAGGEFACMFVLMAVVYHIVAPFGAAAQAGFGVGSRVMQAIFLPVMAIAFAVAPIAGQNFGAGQFARVRETLVTAICIESVLMVLLTALCQINPAWLIRPFASDASVIAVGAQYLHIISWNFVATGIVFACSGLFQALGNTWPAFIGMALRVLTFVLVALWLSRQPGFTMNQVWYLSVATVALQAVVALLLVRTQLNRRLAASTAAAAAMAPA